MQDPELPDTPNFDGSNPAFLIGPVSVYPERGLLEGPDGERVQLEPRVMQVLVELARRAGSVVRRRDLEQAVWSGMVVSDDALNRCIYQLRHALGALIQQAATGPAIETLRKRGYRLRLPVRRLDRGAGPEDGRTGAAAVASRPASRWRSGPAAMLATLALGAALAAVYLIARESAEPQPEPVSVAVLPFLNLTGDPELEVVADGFAEQLLHDLANVPSLRVAARTSSFFFKDKSLEATTIADQMDVDLLIEGSLRKARDSTRITVQLIDRQGFHEWSGEFDRVTGDSLRLQSEISREVLAAMGWGEQQQPVELPSESIANYQAYDKYLRGRFRLAGSDPAALDDARRLFQDALELEPKFGRALTGVADAWSLGIWRRSVDRDVATRAAMHAIEAALAIDGDLSEAHASRGLLHLCLNEYQAAEAPLRRAIALNPNALNAHIWLGLALVYQDRFSEGTAAYLDAQKLNPMDAVLNRNLGANLLITGQVDAGLSYLQRAWTIEPSSPLIYQMLAGWNRTYGRLAESLDWAERGLKSFPEDKVIVTALATTLLQQGEFDAARRKFDQARSMDPGDALLLTGLFSLYLATGDRQAMDDLLAGLDDRDGRFGQDRIVLRWALIRALIDGDPAGAISLAEARSESDALTCNAFMEPGPKLYLAFALRESGDRAGADAIVRECGDLLRQTVANGGGHPKLAYRAALIALLEDNPTEAAEQLTRAAEQGWTEYWQAWNDPLWAAVRLRPEFKTIFDSVRRRVSLAASERRNSTDAPPGGTE